MNRMLMQRMSTLRRDLVHVSEIIKRDSVQVGGWVGLGGAQRALMCRALVNQTAGRGGGRCSKHAPPNLL